MSKEKIILVGGGGHCKSVIDVIESTGLYSIVGIVDIKEKLGTDILGYKIIATDEQLPELVKKYKNFHITLGHIKSNSLRSDLFNQLKAMGAHFPTIKSPLAHVSRHSVCNSGTIIMHYAVVNAGVVIGENCIINTRALIEHDTVIANQVHISTGAIINGDCKICKNVFVGSGAVVSNNISINDNCIIGAGSVVIKDILKEGTYAGNPAKTI